MQTFVYETAELAVRVSLPDRGRLRLWCVDETRPFDLTAWLALLVHVGLRHPRPVPEGDGNRSVLGELELAAAPRPKVAAVFGGEARVLGTDELLTAAADGLVEVLRSSLLG